MNPIRFFFLLTVKITKIIIKFFYNTTSSQLSTTIFTKYIKYGNTETSPTHKLC